MSRHYPDYHAMAAALPSRTLRALRSRAADLGIQTKRTMWTAAEVAVLRRLWLSHASRSEIYAALPRFTRLAIQEQARHQGFRRMFVTQRAIGDPFTDAVKAEVIKRRITNRQLDDLVGSKGHFRNGSPGVTQRHFVLAAEALGGTVTIVWDD